MIVFRDGVGDGQLSVSAKYEAEQFKDCFKHISDDYSPGLGFVVVQKRINTRIFLMQGKECENPAPGTVLDHTVTKTDWYDFFLVSQHVGQGTVSATLIPTLNTFLKTKTSSITLHSDFFFKAPFCECFFVSSLV